MLSRAHSPSGVSSASSCCLITTCTRRTSVPGLPFPVSSFYHLCRRQTRRRLSVWVAGTWGGSSLLSSQPLLAAVFLFWTDQFAPECPRLLNFVDLLLARLATLDRRGQQGYFRFQRRSLQIFLLEPRLLVLA